MSDNTVWIVSLFFGLFALMIVWFVVIIAPGQRKNGKEYDERQIMARNQAYKYSFVLLLLYCTACAILEIVGIKWALMPVMLFIGIFCSVTLFVIICIIKDAYNEFHRKNKPSGFMNITLMYGVFGLYRFIRNIYEDESIFTDGMLNGNIIYLISAVMFLSMYVTKMISDLMKKADEEA